VKLPHSKRTLSPRDLGVAIGVSESSVKRWIDAGRLPAKITSGGHRRIELLPALQFLHDTKRQLLDPAVLGLSQSALETVVDLDVYAERLFEQLHAGDQNALEQDLVAVLAIGLLDPAELFDGPLRSALRRIGELWHGDHRGIYVEHRATTALLGALERVHALYDVEGDAPVAVGGSITGDPSLIPTRMVAIVLAHAGFRALDLGANTPRPALVQAAEELNARLVWASASYLNHRDRQNEDMTQLVAELADRSIPCVLGGREIERLELPAEHTAHVLRSMRELRTLATDLQAQASDNESRT